MATFWDTAIRLENWVEQELNYDSSEDDILLFDPEKGFTPNRGGQTEFFSLYPIQSQPMEFSDEMPRWTALLGGIGSGKSMSGAVWLISQAEQFPEQRFLILANSFPQLYQSTILTLVETCRKYNVPLEPYAESPEEQAIKIANVRRCRLGTKRTFVRVLSMGSFYGKYQSSRGQEIQACWLDEGGYSHEQAFMTLDGRLRSSFGAFCRGVITTSPNGFNWLYYRFGDPAREDSLKKLYKLIHCTTRENQQHLGEHYVASLEANYTEDLARQELEGAFVSVNTSGAVFKYFSRRIHALTGVEAEVLDYDPGLPLHLSFDFNYSPAVAVFAQIRQGEIHVFHEEYLLDSDIWALADAVADWLQKAQPQTPDIYIYGDASGSQRTVHSRQSAWDVIFQQLKPCGTLHRRFPKANPPIRNRVNSVNCILKQERLFVNLKTCPELVKDLETVTWRKEELDKADKLRSHLADALGYLVHIVAPFDAPTKPQMGSRKIQGVAA